jgi:hypothetical protein
VLELYLLSVDAVSDGELKGSMVILCVATSPLTYKTRTRVKRMNQVVFGGFPSNGKVSSFMSSI